jgi:predicted transcriptional regulator
MRLLLSIKPEYAEQILEGVKLYEFRRVPVRRPVTKLILYATLPIGKVVGECRVELILTGTVSEVWRRTADFGGLSHAEYARYFRGARYAVALRVADPVRYDEPMVLTAIAPIRVPPQSFCYLDEL